MSNSHTDILVVGFPLPYFEVPQPGERCSEVTFLRLSTFGFAEIRCKSCLAIVPRAVLEASNSHVSCERSFLKTCC